MLLQVEEYESMHAKRGLYLHAKGAFEKSPMTLKRDTLTRALAQRTRSDEQRAQRRSFIMNGMQGPDAGKLARTYSAEADTRAGGGGGGGAGGRRASMPHAAGAMLQREMGSGGGDRSSMRRSSSGDVAHVRGGHGDEHRYPKEPW